MLHFGKGKVSDWEGTGERLLGAEVRLCVDPAVGYLVVVSFANPSSCRPVFYVHFSLRASQFSMKHKKGEDSATVMPHSL